MFPSITKQQYQVNPTGTEREYLKGLIAAGAATHAHQSL
jgi:hypothetical protein